MTKQKEIRVLWASSNCLLDTTSGASIAVREILRRIAHQGIKVQAYTGTIFDNESGVAGFDGKWPEISNKIGELITVEDDAYQHVILVSRNLVSNKMSNADQTKWFSGYRKMLLDFKPHIVFFYGGTILDFLVAAEAKAHGAGVAFLLVNGNYHNDRWHRDVDLIFTDSQATANLYEQRLAIKVIPTGTFIDPVKVVAKNHQPMHLLFVNPCPQKGVTFVLMIALLLQQRRPDIIIEVVDSRGGWSVVADKFFKALGGKINQFSNVVVTPHTNDMRPVFQRAKLLLAPSLWWESGARVIAEAALNGIPSIITDNGGMPEMMGDAGVKIKVDSKFNQPPFGTVPSPNDVEPFIQEIIKFYDDHAYYQAMVKKAQAHAKQKHDIVKNASVLVHHLTDLAQQFPQHTDQPHPLVLVCGPWSSGTSATAGMISEMGVPSPGPFYEIKDSKTPHTFESDLFRRVMITLVSEKTLQVKQSSQEVIDLLLQFRDGPIHDLLEKNPSQQNKAIMFKHPLSCFILKELAQVFNLRVVVVARNLQDIEKTRVRRNWHKNFGIVGAQKIYDATFKTLLTENIPYSVVRYEDLLASPANVFEQLKLFLNIVPTSIQRKRAINSVRRQSPMKN